MVVTKKKIELRHFTPKDHEIFGGIDNIKLYPPLIGDFKNGIIIVESRGLSLLFCYPPDPKESMTSIEYQIECPYGLALFIVRNLPYGLTEDQANEELGLAQL